MYLLKMLGYYLIPGQKVPHTPRHKSSQSRPCWVAEALPLRRCVFLSSENTPTEKSWVTLSDTVIQAGDSLGTWKSWLPAPK